ncbi:possible NOL1/NOP2/sun family protein [Pseudooceanicola batsensis HTCC2597]|uniref:Possible NOL1/NOP2/sun family protein n=1 Tax=Pseudooceanicola batsensis (strain ATCC BAA-863 / DSM 15984 / KCTC 12145 / HTCC2597) TaxID=252305 RepID=A3TWS5_PSEBH|nr:RsmB/NOP family class I SAM-dependent RNA methyltransferase [Pseudooceanicola batsensis]EAQ03285.1 possible NOL1/NOP2/sun family protein [Pseudooceanicola batsensis HTCC2597]
MTPEARIATAADLLDVILAGDPAERALTDWARRNRYAGSRDRAAIRDHVYDALRCRRSFALLGGGETGRGLMLGYLLSEGRDPRDVFTGQGYGPAPLTGAEAAALAETPAEALRAAPRPVACDMPDWLWPQLETSLGDRTETIAAILRRRAPVFLRVNLRKTDRAAARAALAAEEIVTRPHALAETALEVTDGARRVAMSRAYDEGLVELQDAASQAVAAALPLREGLSVLDYCAGGGGKTLAIAGRIDGTFTAHDADAGRMADLPERARRAGIAVTLTDRPRGPFDLVLCDVPCSGSGAWRRSPSGKWALSQETLDRLNATQLDILKRAAGLVAPGGTLAYVTCSLLRAENQERVAAFRATDPGWRIAAERQFLPDEGGDGFYLACLSRTG